MESCRVTHFFVSSVSADSQHESELIPATVIVRLVDAHFACEQANDKCDRGDDPVPESGPKTSRLGRRRLLRPGTYRGTLSFFPIDEGAPDPYESK